MNQKRHIFSHQSDHEQIGMFKSAVIALSPSWKPTSAREFNIIDFSGPEQQESRKRTNLIQHYHGDRRLGSDNRRRIASQGNVPKSAKSPRPNLNVYFYNEEAHETLYESLFIIFESLWNLLKQDQFDELIYSKRWDASLLKRWDASLLKRWGEIDAANERGELRKYFCRKGDKVAILIHDIMTNLRHDSLPGDSEIDPYYEWLYDWFGLKINIKQDQKKPKKSPRKEHSPEKTKPEKSSKKSHLPKQKQTHVCSKSSRGKLAPCTCPQCQKNVVCLLTLKDCKKSRRLQTCIFKSDCPKCKKKHCLKNCGSMDPSCCPIDCKCVKCISLALENKQCKCGIAEHCKIVIREKVKDPNICVKDCACVKCKGEACPKMCGCKKCCHLDCRCNTSLPWHFIAEGNAIKRAEDDKQLEAYIVFHDLSKSIKLFWTHYNDGHWHNNEKNAQQYIAGVYTRFFLISIHTYSKSRVDP